jgi:hypothetical protein
VSTATSDTATLDADRYLKDVAPHLVVLPPEERADLLDDLAQHLHEIAAEPGPPLAERLGPPEAYAAELLASAGVTAADAAPPPLLARAASLLGRGRQSWVGQEVVRLMPVLRPAWWVTRAYLAVSLLSGSAPDSVLPRLAGSHFLGLLGVLVAIPLSVRLGQRTLTRPGRLSILGANAVLAVYAIWFLGHAGDAQVRYVDAYGDGSRLAAASGCLAAASGQPITNIYAYDAEGRLLDPVLLYDQNGQPIDNLCPEFDERGRRLSTEYRRDVNGSLVINAFPRRQTVSAQPDPRGFARPPSPAQPVDTVPVRPPAVVVPRLAPTTTPTTTPSTATPTTTVPG